MQDSYVSMITSYLNTVHLDDNKIIKLKLYKLLCSCFVQLLVSRVIATAIAERRSLHLQDLVFKNKATKSRLQTLSTNSSDMCLRKYFGVNITDAKDT